MQQDNPSPRRRLVPLIITLAIVAPGIIAALWVGYYVANHQPSKHGAPAPLVLSAHRATLPRGLTVEATARGLLLYQPPPDRGATDLLSGQRVVVHIA